MRKRKRELTALYEEECSASATQEEPEKTEDQPKEEETDGKPKKKREQTDDNRRETTDDAILQPEERAAFYRLLDEGHIQLFLGRDSCYKIADKYLLAMVLIYFRRANLRTEEYNTYFFPALFLANQFEEDEMFRREIYPWALGPMWTAMKTWMLHLRNLLLLRMRFHAWVTRDTCDLIMAQDPEYWAWKRERKEHQGWAIRWYRRDPGEYIPRGPWWIPPACSVCITNLQPCAGEENTKQRRTKKEEQNG
ncbi:speedy protein 1-A-like isoform X1 [Hyla sarda]|uniref:speedy protein 1-A-like isoform X1 n=1 Tax=Hyla sarda TaxID=327740 RepID=UPI0024C31374|nr:speedy protein 1-A-like isoform X1 [Hyla sarda]